MASKDIKDTIESDIRKEVSQTSSVNDSIKTPFRGSEIAELHQFAKQALTTTRPDKDLMLNIISACFGVGMLADAEFYLPALGAIQQIVRKQHELIDEKGKALVHQISEDLERVSSTASPTKTLSDALSAPLFASSDAAASALSVHVSIEKTSLSVETEKHDGSITPVPESEKILGDDAPTISKALAYILSIKTIECESLALVAESLDLELKE